MSKIIFLNGCSSAGKTSIVKSIQHLSEEFWLTSGVDSFFVFMPVKYVGFGEKAEQGIQFVPSVDEEGFPLIEIKTGPYGKAVGNLAPQIVKKFADEGFNLIIDEVICDKESLEKYALLLKKRSPSIFCKCNLWAGLNGAKRNFAGRPIIGFGS